MSYLALDLGAGSGRAIIGEIRNEKIHLEEILRFENNPVQLHNTIYWDFLSLFENIKKSISLAKRKGFQLKGIGVDTWGVDFGLLDKNGNLLSNPIVYRDRRTEGMTVEVLNSTSKEELYTMSGIQQMEINTLYQLFSLRKNNDSTLHAAEKLLFIPDLINYFLTGIARNEYTIASTSQLLNARTRQWEKPIFNKLQLPYNLMGEIIQPGNFVGRLTQNIQQETNVDAKVFAVGSHDTASAIAAIPSHGENWAFLSSGTWSLLGVLVDEPILTSEALTNDFTNEGGVNGKILFMKNITGLWLLQRLIAEWEKEEEKKQSYESLLLEAEKVSAFQSIVNSDDTAFSNPQSMSEAIRTYCKKSQQAIPETKGEFVRCVLESLALGYRLTTDKLKVCSGKTIDKICIVGGGSQNNLLNQFTANALGIEVVVGLTEATAIGNIMQQAIADNTIDNWNEGHRIISNSFTFNSFVPENTKEWEQILEKVVFLFD